MTDELHFGIQTNGIKHRHADAMPDIDTRFKMVKDASIFDYVDKTPAPHEVEDFLAARDKYDLPVRAGGWFYTLGRDEPLYERNLAVARNLGSLVHNTQIMAAHASGRPVTNDEVDGQAPTQPYARIPTMGRSQNFQIGRLYGL